MRPIDTARRGWARMADLAGRLVAGIRRVLGVAARALTAVIAAVLVGGAVLVGATAAVAFAGVLVTVAAALWLARRLRGEPAGPTVEPGPDPITV